MDNVHLYSMDNIKRIESVTNSRNKLTELLKVNKEIYDVRGDNIDKFINILRKKEMIYRPVITSEQAEEETYDKERIELVNDILSTSNEYISKDHSEDNPDVVIHRLALIKAKLDTIDTFKYIDLSLLKSLEDNILSLSERIPEYQTYDIEKKKIILEIISEVIDSVNDIRNRSENVSESVNNIPDYPKEFSLLSMDSKMIDYLKLDHNSRDVEEFVKLYNYFTTNLLAPKEVNESINEDLLMKYIIKEDGFDDFEDDIDEEMDDIKEDSARLKTLKKKNNEGNISEEEEKELKELNKGIIAKVKKLASICKKALSFKDDDMQKTRSFKYTLLRMLTVLLILMAGVLIAKVFLVFLGIIHSIIAIIMSTLATVSAIMEYKRRVVDMLQNNLIDIDEKLSMVDDPDERSNLRKLRSSVQRDYDKSVKSLEANKKLFKAPKKSSGSGGSSYDDY